jgi:hypothetical protein
MPYFILIFLFGLIYAFELREMMKTQATTTTMQNKEKKMLGLNTKVKMLLL